jgi:hypothetical protein
MFAESLKVIFSKILSFISTLAGVIVILVIGWFIARVIKELIARLLKAIHFEEISKRAGISDILTKGGIKHTSSELITAFFYWLIMLVVFTTAINTLGLTVLSTLAEKVVNYIPNVISAIFVFVIGVFLAMFLGAVVRTTCANAGLTNAARIGQLIQTVIVIVSIAIALEQLAIGKDIVLASFWIIFGSIGLGVALAFGLGCKDIASKYLAELIQELKKKGES